MKFTTTNTTTHSMPVASCVSYFFDVSGSSSVASLALALSHKSAYCHVMYKSNPSVRYIYALEASDSFYLACCAMDAESAGKFVGLVKKVATSVSKHTDGQVTFLAHTPMPLAEAVLA
jgi:hypothetical protein